MTGRVVRARCDECGSAMADLVPQADGTIEVRRHVRSINDNDRVTVDDEADIIGALEAHRSQLVRLDCTEQAGCRVSVICCDRQIRAICAEAARTPGGGPYGWTATTSPVAERLGGATVHGAMSGP